MTPEALIIANPTYTNWTPFPLAAEAARELAESSASHGLEVVDTNLLAAATNSKSKQRLPTGQQASLRIGI
jgi:hypothetical protein